MFGLGKKSPKLPPLEEAFTYRTVMVDGVQTRVLVPTTGLAYCETVYATGSSPIHIRRVSDAGMTLSGGADTPSFCGLKVSWDTSAVANAADLEARIANAHESNRTCTECADEAFSVLGAI